MPKKIYIVLISIIALLSFLPVFAAETYELIVPIPGEGTKNVGAVANPVDYIFGLYRFSLIAGGALALVVIAYHAIRYITSAGNPSKQGDAKDGIVKAVLGLSLLLGAIVLLNTIGVAIPEALQLEKVAVKTAESEKARILAKPVEPEIDAARIKHDEAQKKAQEDPTIKNQIASLETLIISTELEVTRYQNLLTYHRDIRQRRLYEEDYEGVNQETIIIDRLQTSLNWEEKILAGIKSKLEILKNQLE